MKKLKEKAVVFIEQNKNKLLALGLTTATIIALVFTIKNAKGIDGLLKVKKTIRFTRKVEEQKTVKFEPIENILGQSIFNKTQETMSLAEEETSLFVEKIIQTKAPHETRGHPMKLKAGFSPSPEKILQAAEMGIEIPEGCTWRNNYKTGDLRNQN